MSLHSLQTPGNWGTQPYSGASISPTSSRGNAFTKHLLCAGVRARFILYCTGEAYQSIGDMHYRFRKTGFIFFLSRRKNVSNALHVQQLPHGSPPVGVPLLRQRDGNGLAPAVNQRTMLRARVQLTMLVLVHHDGDFVRGAGTRIHCMTALAGFDLNHSV
jgi:hypothetical protein